MQKYDSYKDSGVQWLGEIPSHWEVVKTSCVFSNIGSGTTPNSSQESYYSEEGVNFLQTGDLNDSLILNTAKKITEKALRDTSLKIYSKGSLIIAMYGATIGKLGILGIDTTVNQACCVLPTSKKICTKYAFYIFMIAKTDLLLQSKGGGQPNISQDTIKNEKIVLPPLSEQQAIVAYLDTATAKIDTAIAQQQKMIDLLNERKQIIINNAVTKGLNPNAKMKDSGVEWIGEVPEHWEVRRLKHIARLKSGDTINSDSLSDVGFPVYGGNGFRGYTDRYTNDGSYVLIGRQGALCGNVNYATGKFFASEHAVVVYPYDEENILWLGETIKASNLNQYSQSAAQPGLAVSVIENIAYPYPPKDERNQIANHLQHVKDRIDTSISNAAKQIVLLQERKQIIINDVVTGKVKVC